MILNYDLQKMTYSRKYQPFQEYKVLKELHVHETSFNFLEANSA